MHGCGGVLIEGLTHDESKVSIKYESQIIEWEAKIEQNGNNDGRNDSGYGKSYRDHKVYPNLCALIWEKLEQLEKQGLKNQ